MLISSQGKFNGGTPLVLTPKGFHSYTPNNQISPTPTNYVPIEFPASGDLVNDGFFSRLSDSLFQFTEAGLYLIHAVVSLGTVVSAGVAANLDGTLQFRDIPANPFVTYANPVAFTIAASSGIAVQAPTSPMTFSAIVRAQVGSRFYMEIRGTSSLSLLIENRTLTVEQIQL